ncbi:MAG: DUF1015 domain-containing protein [Chlorobiaceae bacterium]|nr:DUF1015 domain-containing protein [Chlorobiaceae bacterium]
MPQIAPFKGIVYTSAVAGDAAKLICPPYDAISPALQQELYDLSPYNAVRMELPTEADPYSAAAGRLHDWLASGVLTEESTPALYPCSQTFTDETGKEHTRNGFFAALRLYDFAEQQVLPHERTLSGPKADRLNMFRKTAANLSSIFGLYADESMMADAAISEFCRSNEPLIEATFQGVQNRLWRITEPSLVNLVQSVLAERKVYIADGHHRYETGVAYRNECAAAHPEHTGNEAFNFILAYLTNIHDEGLLVQPIHRLVHKLPSFDPECFITKLDRHFTVWELPGRKALDEFLAGCSKCLAYGIVLPGKTFAMTLDCKPAEALSRPVPEVMQQLGVVLLHDLVFSQILGITDEATRKESNLVYVKNEKEVFDAVASGSAQLGIVMKPTEVGQVVAVAASGEVMPQKSTWFYPKVMTGMVFRSLEADS